MIALKPSKTMPHLTNKTLWAFAAAHFLCKLLFFLDCPKQSLKPGFTPIHPFFNLPNAAQQSVDIFQPQIFGHQFKAYF
jgi:hypothetical protein